MMTTDIDALHATLDLDPADQQTRRVLSDAYEDAGDWVMADGLRWMADRKRVPFAYGNSYWWAVESSTAHDHPGRIPASCVSASRVHSSRRAAEESLCRALARQEVTR